MIDCILKTISLLKQGAHCSCTVFQKGQFDSWKLPSNAVSGRRCRLLPLDICISACFRSAPFIVSENYSQNWSDAFYGFFPTIFGRGSESTSTT